MFVFAGGTHMPPASPSPTMPPPHLPAPSLPPHPPRAPGALELPSRGSFVPLGRSRGPLQFSGSRWAQWPPLGKFSFHSRVLGPRDVPTHSPMRSPSLPVAKQRLQGSRHVQRRVWRASAAGAGSCACTSGRAPASSLLGRPRWLNSHGRPSLSAASNDVARARVSCAQRRGFRCFVVS